MIFLEQREIQPAGRGLENGEDLSDGTARQTTLLDGQALATTLAGLAFAVRAELDCLQQPVIVGIERRGAVLALRLREIISRETGRPLPYGSLDISLYHDDHTEIADFPIVSGSDIPFSLAGKDVILVDDMLNSGRTALAALKALHDRGRPSTVRLAVLLFNSTGRELPIVPDFHGKLVSLEATERLTLALAELDDHDTVYLSSWRSRNDE